MEKVSDLSTILPFLPVFLRSSSLFWPSQVVEALQSMSKGPDHSRVDSGELFFLAVDDIRCSLSLSHDRIHSSASDGYALFFDEMMSRSESKNWFGEVVPFLANLLLRLPSLLETHYRNAGSFMFNGMRTSLRIMEKQEAGIVFLNQELIAALLACSFFSLFPTTNRGAKHLPTINFDHMFASLYQNYVERQENKIWCIIHYFERIHVCMPIGFVSFERKVLPLDSTSGQVSYPTADLWSKSLVPLCQFEIHNSGLMEDQISGGLEVDFANKYLGGGALHGGCVQEEIRFMINPELISGMLFLPSMSDNEAIEIVGTERFANYKGYASSFRFTGDYIDNSEVDSYGRRKTRIVAIDAVSNARTRQYEHDFLLREINKAFCGFLDSYKHQQYQSLFRAHYEVDVRGSNTFLSNLLLCDRPLPEPSQGISGDGISLQESGQCISHHDDIGIVTGNWGCGAFGGDPELKSIIQWLAASQALRPFVSYFTFGAVALRDLDKVTRWIVSHKWTVGDLWHMLVEYSLQRYDGDTNLGFFAWLVPSISDDDIQMHDISQTP